jgi:GAF domain-containing protein/anti-sigma regulatory factor (Ser/Thr protein kinase)
MWVHYDQPRHISEAESDALQLYVNQAAIAYDSARRIKELEHMRQAADALAGVAGQAEVLEQIVHSARAVLQADSTVLLSYDVVREQFVLERAVVAGISVEQLAESRKIGSVRLGGTIYTIMEQGWIGVSDVQDTEQYPFLGEATRQLLEKIGARSFQGIAFIVDNEKLGILYVNYNIPRGFSEEERQIAQTFANHAALALKKAQLLNQVSKAHSAAHVVAEVMVLENLASTLDAIVKGTREVLGCDAVTLYTYDQDQDRFSFPPAMVGVHFPHKVAELGQVEKPSVIYNVLALDDLYEAENTQADPLLCGPFVKREEIVSSMGVPLIARERRVGVMFINYRRTHRSTNDEQLNIRLFANQAAAAIRNAQLHEKARRRVVALRTLYEAGQAVTVSLKLDRILSRIAEQAWKLMGTRGTEAQLSHLSLLEGSTLRFKAAYPGKYLRGLKSRIGDIDLNRTERVGITGRAVKTAQVLLVGDIGEDPDYIAYDPKTHSQLAVPIKRGDKIIGVINVEHSFYNAFDAEDQRAMEALAAQASIAIHNAQLFQETQRHAHLLDAAAKVARDATATLEIDELLNATVRLISERFGFYHAGVFLLDDRREYAVLQATFPPNDLGMLRRGHRLRVGKEGIVGHVTRTGKPHFAPDVDTDRYHLRNPLLAQTRSEMVFPLIARGEVIGALDVQSTDVVELKNEDVATLQIMADQLSNAFNNARLYQQATESLEESNMLQQVAVSLAGTSELQDVLNLMMREAMKVANTTEGGIHFWDAQAELFTQSLQTNSDGTLQPYISMVRPRGITWRIITERRSYVTSDILLEPDSNPAYVAKGYRAAVGIPLVSQDEAIGVLYVRCTEPRQFSDRQVTLLETLASQTAVAIDRARGYEELKRTKGLVGSRTALAWMGMANSAWRHSIEGHAINIRNVVTLLRQEMAAAWPGQAGQPAMQKIAEKLNLIERLAVRVLEKPITPPLSSEEGVEKVMINDLICERIDQLWQNEEYQAIIPSLHLDPAANSGSLGSPEWLRRALDLLVDNAVEAMADVPVRQLTISTSIVKDKVEIAIKDTGKGIKAEFRDKLFKERIEPSEDHEGLGMGLLIVQAIVQTYGGDVSVRDSDSCGTTMVVLLPLIQ